MRHGDVGEAHFDGLCRRIAPIEVPDLARLLLADHASQISSSESGIDGAYLRTNLAELRLVGRNRQIADRCKYVAATDRESVDSGDHRLRHVADHALELVDGQADRAPAIVLSVMRALVPAGAERLVAGAGQNDNATDLSQPAR